MNTAPEVEHKGSGKRPEPLTRLKAYEGQGRPIVLPPLTHRYLAEWWMKIGPTMAGGMSEGPVTWQEIDAWKRTADVDLEPWEAEAVRAMSAAFVSQRQDARKSACPAPFSNELPKEERDRVADQFKAMASALAGRKR